MDVQRTTRAAAPRPPSSPNPRLLARLRKRQVLTGSLVGFGASLALVMSHPMAASQASAATDPGSLGGGQTAPQPLTPAQPAPTTFFRSGGGSQTFGGGVTTPNLRSGGGRRGSLGSGGS